MSEAFKRIYDSGRASVYAVLIVALLCGVIFSSSAQAAGWTTDLDAAHEKAKVEEKPILYAFVGRGWDNPSMNFVRNVLYQRKVVGLLQDSFVMIELSIPINPDNTAEEIVELQKKYGVRLVPELVVVNSKGRKVDSVSYQVKPLAWYVKKFERIKSRYGAKEKK